MKTVVDLFCGSGAVTLGLKKAGFRVVGAVDFDPIACATYRSNHPEVEFIEEDIKTVEPSVFSAVEQGGLDLLVVCAPCQPFSNRNNNRSNKDVRIGLVLESLRFVQAFQPKMVFFENVPGLGKQPVFKKLAQGLNDLGYMLSEPRHVDAADFGVPQRRQRMILLAAKEKNILQDASGLRFAARRSVRDTIGDLPVPPIRTCAVNGDVLHFARLHAAITMERLKHLPSDGGSRASLPDRLQLACHKNRKRNSFPDSYGRMKWDDVAPTLTTGCTDLTKGRYAHPAQNRSITLREAARLQSFPDDYLFVGNASQIATQIGNAVPPQMMFGIAQTLHAALSS